MALPRPSKKRLNKLLMTNPAKFERYLVNYPDIAEHFEADNPLRDLRAPMRTAFDAAIDVPNDLAVRLRARMTEAQAETTPFAVLLDLVGVGIATLSVLVDEEPLAPDGSPSTFYFVL